MPQRILYIFMGYIPPVIGKQPLDNVRKCSYLQTSSCSDPPLQHPHTNLFSGGHCLQACKGFSFTTKPTVTLSSLLVTMQESKQMIAFRSFIKMSERALCDSEPPRRHEPLVRKVACLGSICQLYFSHQQGSAGFVSLLVKNSHRRLIGPVIF